MSSTHWNDPPHTGGQSKIAAAWRGVDAGLKLVLLGYTLLAVGVLLAVTLHGLAAGGLLTQQPRVYFTDKDDVLMPVLVTLGLAVLAGYGAILAGHLRCCAAPPHVEARDTMYAGMACLVLGAVSVATSLLLEGGSTGLGVLRGWSGVERLDFSAVGGLFQLGGLGLMLLSYYCFNYFLRSVAVGEGEQCRGVDLLLLYLALLVGCSIGAAWYLHQLPWKLPVLLALGAGWVACGVWHIHRIDSARKAIAVALASSRPEMAPHLLMTPGGVPPALSGVRRVLKAMKK
jgi:hypothetical protein